MMTKMTKGILLVILILVFLRGIAQGGFGLPEEEWEDWKYEERLTGKDFVALGQLEWIHGNLLTEDDEWFLLTQEDLYEIHFGDHTYREDIGLVLIEGEEVSICGYLYKNDMAVVSLIIADKIYDFRTQEGTPLWGAFRGNQMFEIRKREGHLQQLNRTLSRLAHQEKQEQEKQDQEKEQKEQKEDQNNSY